MDAAGFQAGAGVDPAALRDASVSMVGLAVILWAAWTANGLHRLWRDGGIGFWSLAVGVVRATALAMAVIYFMQ